NFNNYFINIGETISAHLPDYTDTPLAPVVHSGSLNEFNTVTPLDILKEINKLKNVKASSGIINPIILKRYKHILCAPISSLFNKCIETGILPNVFKLATVLPLFKKDDAKDFNNYRPTLYY